jgi:DNA-binding transcriptional regulator GbsR (MarR family)
MHQHLNKTKAQIKALNNQIKEGKVKNEYAVKNKIKTLKKGLKVALDNYNWENYLSN